MFVDRYDLRRHELVHTKHRPYLCDKCSQSFTQKVSFARHMLIHLRKKGFHCPHCPMKFRQKSNLDAHVKQVHPPPDDPELEKRFHCKKCPSAFKTDGRLRTHRARLHGEMVMFDQCVKRTANVANHASGEEDSEDDEDEEPGSEDSQSSTQGTEQEGEIVKKIVLSRRTEHMKGKTPQRPHECQICKAAFLKKAHLYPHMVSHHGFKAFQCVVCDKKYSTKQSLNSHTNLHSLTDFPFSCDDCGESFSRLSTLKRHQTMMHHSQNCTYRCPYCKKQIRWLQNCRAHIRRFHRKSDSLEGGGLLEPIKEAIITSSDNMEANCANRNGSKGE
uniref:C2H2-type domain-containing protein n=1 Tax=Anopheles christyi TaxID=43041 RepID=A0A182K0M8_9DIPT